MKQKQSVQLVMGKNITTVEACILYRLSFGLERNFFGDIASFVSLNDEFTNFQLTSLVDHGLDVAEALAMLLSMEFAKDMLFQNVEANSDLANMIESLNNSHMQHLFGSKLNFKF